MNDKELNRSLYVATAHLAEAAKHLSNIDAFIPEARLLMMMAEKFSELIEPEVAKVSEDKMLSILDEIAAFSEGQL